MEKPLERVTRGFIALLAMAVALLFAIAFKFAVCAPDLFHMVLQRIGG